VKVLEVERVLGEVEVVRGTTLSVCVRACGGTGGGHCMGLIS